MRRTLEIASLGAALSAVLGAGCATAPAPAPVDLTAARAAVAAARADGGAEPAKAFVTRAEAHLSAAEKTAGTAKPEERSRAEALAELAATEAEAASALGKISRELSAALREPEPAPNDPERARLKSRLAKALDDQKRLEEKLALLQRDLDATETEVIRTKAKLKGIETKAEASSAIAEARILMLRMQDEKGRPASLARSQEKLERAERQLREQNYGAALFFALQAQQMLEETRRATATTPPKK